MTKIACIGDSITSGFTLLNPNRDSYPSLLQNMLGSNDTKRRNWDRKIFRRDYRKIASSYMELPLSSACMSDCPRSHISCLGHSTYGAVPGNDGRGCPSGNSRDCGRPRPSVHRSEGDIQRQFILHRRSSSAKEGHTNDCRIHIQSIS